ncbi:DUF1203 domain-containing protein [Streptomyces sp. 8K308]|uniref:DUF1203 domain-containing protein n=1 Tax=Streptomyces sp. 8K308 TaxID=2530388 RepID=UPI0010428966|nr:DUF1203 domain-containing protein [Streptomyces sp. 8K308]TDC15997.1 DUF1203 domain-containing protein [Streptomyces sp. 8K308]
MTTTTTTATFRVHALPFEVLEGVRATGLDAFGARAERLAAEGGEPVRCCLSDARPGEELLLFGYEPPLPAASPYREIGAVLTHAEPCPGPADPTAYPADWRGRPQVLRAYDARGWIHDATTVHDGQDPESTIARLLAEPDVVRVHSRNIAWGCYMFALTRA